MREVTGYIIPIYGKVWSILPRGRMRIRWHPHDSIFSTENDAIPTLEELKSRGIKTGKITKIMMRIP